MKKSIVAALVLVACLLLAPFGFGKLAEKRVNAGLDALVKRVPYVVITERTWQGGWFKSRQEVTFEVAPAFRGLINPRMVESAIAEAMAEGAVAAADAAAPAEAPAEGEEAAAAPEVPATPAPAKLPGFKIFNDVVHGPVLGSAGIGLARVDTTIDLPPEAVEKIRELFGPEPALQVRSRLGFLGGGSTVLTSSGRTLKPDDDVEIIYEDFELVVGFGRKADTYSFDGGLPRLEIKGGNGGSAVLTGLTMNGKGDRAQGLLYNSNSALRLGELKFANSGSGMGFSVADLHFVEDTQVKDGFMSSGAQIGSGALDVPQLAALGLEIKEVHYDFTARRLHADTMEKLLNSFADMYSKLPEGGDAAAMAAAMQTEVLGPLKEHAQELLKHDPELSLDRVGLVTPEGEGIIKGLIKLVGITTDDLTPSTYLNLIGKIDADITVEVAQKLVDKIPNGSMVLGMAVSQGFVTRDGDKLTCHIEFRNGELKINGKSQPIPIPGMGGGPPPQEIPGA